MSLSKAITFLKEVRFNETFREKCNLTESKSELLEAEGFNEEEFEDALNMELVKCKSYEEAEHYQQLRWWFALL